MKDERATYYEIHGYNDITETHIPTHERYATESEARKAAARIVADNMAATVWITETVTIDVFETVQDKTDFLHRTLYPKMQARIDAENTTTD